MKTITYICKEIKALVFFKNQPETDKCREKAGRASSRVGSQAQSIKTLAPQKRCRLIPNDGLGPLGERFGRLPEALQDAPLPPNRK